MIEKGSILKDLRILAVDDEADILETIEEILSESKIETARDYQSASLKIKQGHYDLAILDIMGVDGLKLLEEAVDKGILTVMLTAHAISPETLMESIQKGAISYLPKETLVELDDLLNDILGAVQRGEPPWKLLFEKLGEFFDDRFGPEWKAKDHEFWSEFSRNYQISKGIQERLKHDQKIIDKGI